MRHQQGSVLLIAMVTIAIGAVLLVVTTTFPAAQRSLSIAKRNLQAVTQTESTLMPYAFQYCKTTLEGKTLIPTSTPNVFQIPGFVGTPYLSGLSGTATTAQISIDSNLSISLGQTKPTWARVSFVSNGVTRAVEISLVVTRINTALGAPTYLIASCAEHVMPQVCAELAKQVLNLDSMVRNHTHISGNTYTAAINLNRLRYLAEGISANTIQCTQATFAHLTEGLYCSSIYSNGPYPQIPPDIIDFCQSVPQQFVSYSSSPPSPTPTTTTTPTTVDVQ